MPVVGMPSRKPVSASASCARSPSVGASSAFISCTCGWNPNRPSSIAGFTFANGAKDALGLGPNSSGVRGAPGAPGCGGTDAFVADVRGAGAGAIVGSDAWRDLLAGCALGRSDDGGAMTASGAELGVFGADTLIGLV
jgi:hypothetical protein